ncbi:hypothetical protein ACLB2K_019888 [Fragaria x ananassa]
MTWLTVVPLYTVKSCHRNWQHAGEVIVVEVENTEVSEVGELRRERAVEDVEEAESGEAGVGVVEGRLEGEEGAWGWRIDGGVRRESGGGGGGEGGGRGGGDAIFLVLDLFVVVVWRRRRRRRRRRRGRNMSSVGFICGYIKNFSRRNYLFSSAKLFG